MNGMTRKEREIAQREEAILKVAAPMVIRDGYHGLKMDRIAEELEYSKGTIYNHFPCKEEILLALAVNMMQKRTQMFRRAALFQGTSRERLQAVGVASELFVRLNPDLFHLEQLVLSASIASKTTEKRRQKKHSAEQECMSTVSGIVRDAIAQGDLILNDRTPEDLVFGLWSMTFGAYSLMTTNHQLLQLGIEDPFVAIHKNGQSLVNGVGWQPIFTEEDVESVVAKIKESIFEEETKMVQEFRSRREPFFTR